MSDNDNLHDLSKGDANFAAVADLGAEAIVTKTVQVPGLGFDIPLALKYEGIGEGYSEIDLAKEADKWRSFPRRRTGTATALTLQAFSDLVERHKDSDSAIFANLFNLTEPSLTAVIDYHTTGDDIDTPRPRFGQHRIVHKFPLSVEWRQWAAMNSKEMSQQVFADWLDEHLPELASPTDAERAQYEDDLGLTFGTPREILQLSRGLQVNVASTIVNVVKPQSGAGSIVFQEEHQDTEGKPIKVPGLVMLGIPLFFGGAQIRVPVRLRYQIKEKKLVWTFVLHRSQQIVHEALLGCLSEVERATGLPIYEGAPEA